MHVCMYIFIYMCVCMCVCLYIYTVILQAHDGAVRGARLHRATHPHLLPQQVCNAFVMYLHTLYINEHIDK